MRTESDFDRQLRSVLRDGLDREWGPDRVWEESPAARRVDELRARGRRGPWPIRVLAVAALLTVGGAAVVGALIGRPPVPAANLTNGWVAFAAGGSPDPLGETGERDIYLVREDQPARRIIGSDTDRLDQICPAFSSDGTRLAFGQAEGTSQTGYRDTALVVADLDASGNASESHRIEVAGQIPPPCANWSPDGRRIAFMVSPSAPVLSYPRCCDPTIRDVWVVTLDGEQITVLSDLSATDLEWSPDGTQLAMAVSAGEPTSKGAIRLYSVLTGETRFLDGPSGVSSLSWSPDGRRIAYQRGPSGADSDQEIWVAELDGSRNQLLASGFSASHGIGPVWSPAGDRIVYQRVCASDPSHPGAPCQEQHEVVLISPDNGGEIVLPDVHLAGADEQAVWFPFRVTWSPDGQDLLFTAWGGSPDGPSVALIMVPVAPGSLPRLLHGDDFISVYDGDGLLPIQSWGREPGD